MWIYQKRCLSSCGSTIFYNCQLQRVLYYAFIINQYSLNRILDQQTRTIQKYEQNVSLIFMSEKKVCLTFMSENKVWKYKFKIQKPNTYLYFNEY